MCIHLLLHWSAPPTTCISMIRLKITFQFQEVRPLIQRSKKTIETAACVLCLVSSSPNPSHSLSSPLKTAIQSLIPIPPTHNQHYLYHYPLVMSTWMALRLALSGSHRDYSKNRNFEMRLNYPVQGGKYSSVYCSSNLRLSHLHSPCTLLQRETWIAFPPRALD